jgi:charged multivesicular body protein 7
MYHRARLAALYSDFSSLRTLNPDGYSANITAWTQGLSHAARAGSLPSNDSLILSLDSPLYQELETKEWGRPLALGTVVSEAVQKKEFMVLREFVEAKESIYRSPWRIPGIGEILGWGLKQLGLGFGGPKIGSGKMVLLSNLEVAGKEFEGRTKGQRSRVERIYSLSSFKETYRDLLGTRKGLSDADFEVLLRYLQRDKGVVSWVGETVKLRTPGEADVVAQEDATIASLKTLIKDLEIQTKTLEAKVDELNVTARQAVEKKNRVSALATLRSKKLAEGTLVKRHATLAQLEEVFVSIERAADQVELVHIMEGSAKVLAWLNKQVGGVERVDDVVENLREQMGQVDEVGNVIAEPGQSGVDEGEVDDELEAMEGEERRKIEEVEKKAREETERKETEETRKRLDALDEAQRQSKEKESAETKTETEKEVDESVKALKRMSLDPPEKVPA